MNTIRLSKTGAIILALVILLIIFIAITAISKKGAQNKEDGALARLLKRWQTLQREIQAEMNDLRLTREMEAFLEQKINRLFLIGKAIFLLLFTTITAGYYLSGLDIMTSLLSSAGTTTFICCAVSFITINRFADANEMIQAGRNLIRRIVYKRYGFDPTRAQVLQDSILLKKNEAEELYEVLDLTWCIESTNKRYEQIKI